MTKLVFATHNPHKLQEIRQMMPPGVQLLSLDDIGCLEDIPETAETLEGNALIKASHVWEKYGYDCFADDTGLEVSALNGAPGVYSARYAGRDADAAANMQKLLREMRGLPDRKARFRTVIALIRGGAEHIFEGTVSGEILTEPAGSGGFGYDPIFLPQGHALSFGQMSAGEKNRISHRGHALSKLTAFLHNPGDK